MVNVLFYIIWLYKTDKHSFVQFKPGCIFNKYKIYIVDNMFWITAVLKDFKIKSRNILINR